MREIPASDAEIETMIELLARDLEATRAAKCLYVLPTSVQDVREHWEFSLYRDIWSLTEKVVGDVQQELMDTHVDTTWPTCPRHPNHPLWFHDNSWFCDADGVALARLGGLHHVLPALPAEEAVKPRSFVRRRR